MRAAVFSLAVIAMGLGSADADSALALPAPLQAALASRAPDGDAEGSWRYTVTIASEDGPVVGHYDGALDEPVRWSLVSPSIDALSEAQRTAWDSMGGGDDDDDAEADIADEEGSGGSGGSIRIGQGGGLFFGADQAEMIAGGVEMLSSTSTHIIYGFEPRMDSDGGGDIGHFMRGEISVRLDPPAVEMLRIYAPESFKPHIIARINRFEIRMDYASDAAMPAPVLQQFSLHLEGRAAFQDFSQAVGLVFSDIEYLVP